MTNQNELDYNRVAEALAYIQQNFKSQPDLDEVAEKVHLSPFHFQRLFTEWAGVSPKKFLQYISLQHAKRILKGEQTTLLEAAFQTGLSGTGRLHDLFVNIEGMTPAEYKNEGEGLEIRYSFEKSPFGNLLVASTPKGICHMMFMEHEKEAFEYLRNQFPRAHYTQILDMKHQNALSIFSTEPGNPTPVKLHLKGTDFQLKVWEALLKIPVGKMVSYGHIAQGINQPNASRAVGTAIGSNPVAYVIPCHRVIQSSGLFGGYMWGPNRKTAILGWEAAQVYG